MKYCYDGTNYRNVDSTSTAVACTTLGQIEYSAPNLRFCGTGNLWRKMEGATSFGACASGAGYYYFGSANQYYWYCDGTNWKRVP